MMLKGQDASHIALRQLVLRGRPRGPDASTTCSPTRRSAWSGRRSRTSVETEHEKLGFTGRFGAGLPRINDGSLPVPPAHDLQDEAGRGRRQPDRHRLQRLAAVHWGGRVRRVRDPALDHRERLAGGRRRPPDQLFYNTGISTYFWIVTNRKAPERRGKVQLVDAREYFVEDAEVASGDKRKEISDEQIEEITRLYGDSPRARRSRSSPTRPSATMRITVERPLRVGWEVTSDTIAGLAETKAWEKLQEVSRRTVDCPRGAIERHLADRQEGQGGSRSIEAGLPKAMREGRLAVWRCEGRRGSDRHGSQGRARARPRSA